MRNLSIDIETYSDVDLSKCGVYKYASSSAFEVLLFGYAADGGDVRVVDLACGEQIPEEVISALADTSVSKWAFNAMFERVCLSNFLGEWLEPEGWHCTMVWSATLGLPLSLESAGGSVGIGETEADGGQRLDPVFLCPLQTDQSKRRQDTEQARACPEKWERFKAYNLRDVETEMQIQKRLSNFPVPDAIWEEYHLDQEINDRGIGVDMELVRQAIAMDTRSRERLTDVLQELTGVENPNSVQQMKQWLADHGLETDTLGKKAVAELVKTESEPLKTVLSLRQQLAKSSVKKYTAMENAVCADGRAHGMFQFYGANRTGRFSGRLIQLQNLPQNHMLDLAQARALVRGGDYEALSMLYEDIPDTLSQLIRTAFEHAI